MVTFNVVGDQFVCITVFILRFQTSEFKEISKNKQGISVRLLRPSACPESLCTHRQACKQARKELQETLQSQSSNLKIDISMTSKVRRILESILTRQKGSPHNGHIAIKHFYQQYSCFLITKSLGLFLQSGKLKFYFARAPDNYDVINFYDMLFIIIIL